MRKTLDNMDNYSFTDMYSADNNGMVYFEEVSKFHKSRISVGDKVKSYINKYGYIEYILKDSSNKRKHIQSHRIVASLYIPNPYNKPQVNHIDGNKLNNHISNLEWCTASENEKHSFRVLNKKVWNKGLELPSGEDYKGTIRPVASYTLEGVFIKHTLTQLWRSLKDIAETNISCLQR